MKLNNKGFGTKEMIIYSCVIIFFLLLADFLIKDFYRSMDNNNSKNTSSTSVVETNNNSNNNEIKRTESVSVYYSNQEKKLRDAAISYAIKNKLDAYDGFIVAIGVLIDNNYIEIIRDYYDDSTCNAYAKIMNNGDSYDADAYISCNSYTTEGY